MLEVYLEASWELTREHRVKQAQNVILSGIGSILGIMLGSELKSVLRASMEVFNEVYLAVLLNAA